MKIFITYNRSTKSAVTTLVQDLEELGHKVWFDNELSGGQSWWDNILYNIRECDIYIFAISRKALDSTACKRELEYAKSLQKSSLPVLLETNVSMAIVPRYLSNMQCIDYSNSSDKNSVFALLKAINNLPSSPKNPDPLPDPPPVPISYLDNVKDKIDSPGLDKNDQIALVAELKNKLTDPENKKEDIYELLKRLKRRDDLLASVFLEIDQILNEEIGPEPPVKKSPVKTEPLVSESLAAYSAIPPGTMRREVTGIPMERVKKGWSLALVIVLAMFSIFPPVGILAGIIGFFAGATKKQSLLFIGIALASMFIGILVGLSNSYYY